MKEQIKSELHSLKLIINHAMDTYIMPKILPKREQLKEDQTRLHFQDDDDIQTLYLLRSCSPFYKECDSLSHVRYYVLSNVT
jgi:hypothetical protein